MQIAQPLPALQLVTRNAPSAHMAPTGVAPALTPIPWSAYPPRLLQRARELSRLGLRPLGAGLTHFYDESNMMLPPHRLLRANVGEVNELVGEPLVWLPSLDEAAGWLAANRFPLTVYLADLTKEQLNSPNMLLEQLMEAMRAVLERQQKAKGSRPAKAPDHKE